MQAFSVFIYDRGRFCFNGLNDPPEGAGALISTTNNGIMGHSGESHKDYLVGRGEEEWNAERNLLQAAVRCENGTFFRMARLSRENRGSFHTVSDRALIIGRF